MAIIVSAEFSAEFQVNFAVPRAPPSQAGLSELTWIRDHFGFDNPSVILVVRDPSSYLWALAYNGGLIYFGDLFYLLTNQTDYRFLNNTDPQIRSDYVGSIQRLWIYGVPRKIDSGSYLILVPSDLYNPDVLEMQTLAAYGGGVLFVRQMTTDNLQQLFAAWAHSRSTNDILGAAAPYLAINPIANCTAYSNWASASLATTVRLEQNFTNIFPCSLSVTTKATKDSAQYVILNGIWNLANETYVGFYFKGKANSTGDFFLTILLSSTPNYTSYYYYNMIDAAMWDGTVRGFVLHLSRFQSRDSPDLSDISSFQFGIYSAEGGSFEYSIEYVVLAS
jgi:hypothetical protein